MRLVLLLAALLSPACASTTAHPPRPTHTPDPSVPKCNGDDANHCITAPECQYDEAHQCEACICSPAWEPPGQTRSNGVPPPL